MHNKSPYLSINFAWYYHILFWIGVVLAWVVFIFLTGQDVKEGFINKLCYLPSQLLVTYSFIHLVIPSLFKGKFLRVPILVILLAYLGTVLARFFKIYVYETLLSVEDPKESLVEILIELPPLLGQYMIWVLMTPSMIILGVLYYNHLKGLERVAELRKEKNRTELNFLQAQLHPHFLFNTLNNLYALATQKSDITYTMVDKLYRMVDYMNASESNLSGSTLIDEINLVKDYISLEQLRYGNRLSLNMQIDIDYDLHSIPSLIFLSIVENSFKHGVSGDLDNPWLDIVIKEKNGLLDCSVANSKAITTTKDEGFYRRGIGVNNVKRQLELTYPGTHKIEVIETVDSYKVELSITLRAIANTKAQVS